MTTAIVLIMIALKLPQRPKDLLLRAKAILQAITGNVYFTSPTPTLVAVTSAIAALDLAITVATKRAPGSVAARRATQQALVQLLNHLGDYVKLIAESQPDLAATIVASAGMYIVGRKGRAKAPFAATWGPGTGEAILNALLGKGGRATHYWQFSTDQKNWTSVPDTDRATTTITGLTSGQLYYFRHALMRRNVKTDWSQIVSLLVK